MVDRISDNCRIFKWLPIRNLEPIASPGRPKKCPGLAGQAGAARSDRSTQVTPRTVWTGAGTGRLWEERAIIGHRHAAGEVGEPTIPAAARRSSLTV
jgi:hypothetical protein